MTGQQHNALRFKRQHHLDRSAEAWDGARLIGAGMCKAVCSAHGKVFGSCRGQRTAVSPLPLPPASRCCVPLWIGTVAAQLPVQHVSTTFALFHSPALTFPLIIAYGLPNAMQQSPTNIHRTNMPNCRNLTVVSLGANTNSRSRTPDGP
jgi:hypothetical protein